MKEKDERFPFTAERIQKLGDEVADDFDADKMDELSELETMYNGIDKYMRVAQVHALEIGDLLTVEDEDGQIGKVTGILAGVEVVPGSTMLKYQILTYFVNDKKVKPRYVNLILPAENMKVTVDKINAFEVALPF